MRHNRTRGSLPPTSAAGCRDFSAPRDGADPVFRVICFSVSRPLCRVVPRRCAALMCYSKTDTALTRVRGSLQSTARVIPSPCSPRPTLPRGRSWRQTLNVDRKEAVEAARQRSSMTGRLPDDAIRTNTPALSLIRDALAGSEVLQSAHRRVLWPAGPAQRGHPLGDLWRRLALMTPKCNRRSRLLRPCPRSPGSPGPWP